MSTSAIPVRILGMLFILTAMAASSPVAAEDDGATGLETALFAGAFDIGRDARPFEAGIEIRRPTRVTGLHVAFGLAANEKSSIWIHGGVRYELPISSDWYVTPGLAIALYEQGDGKDLGQTLQFRSSIEAGRRISDRLRVGLGLYHLSNASMSEVNPGSNSLIASFAFRR